MKLNAVNLIFDLDDTLCQCGPHYVDKIEQVSAAVANRSLFSQDACKRIISAIDKSAKELSDGFSKYRFPQTMASLAAVSDVSMGREIDTDFMNEMYAIGESVFTEAYPLFPNVPELLTKLSTRYRLFIFTMGDDEIQMNKIYKNNIHELIPLKNITVTPKKNEEAFKLLRQKYKFHPRDTMMIGDSILHDIKPAILNDFHTCWVKNDYNRDDSKLYDVYPTVNVNTVLELE